VKANKLYICVRKTQPKKAVVVIATLFSKENI